MAVDADTGASCPNFGAAGRIDLNTLQYHGQGQLHSTSPPAIYRDVVIVGGATYDNRWGDSLDGIVRGFDARTGAERWNWNPIPEALRDRVGGANTWAPISVDTERGWIFLPTGSPSYDVLGTARTDPIPHANAVVVLNASTGELVWSFQTVHHDLWDYDLPAIPVLARIPRNDGTVPAVLQPTKQGFVFVLDRLTGAPLFPVEERPFPASEVPGERAAATQPIPLLPAPVTSQSVTVDDAWGITPIDARECRAKLAALRNDGLYTPPSLQGSVLHPSFLGGTNWGGIAYDEASGLAVLNSSNLVASVTLIPRAAYDEQKHRPPGYSFYEMNGSPYVLVRGVLRSKLGAPCNPPPWGRLTAIDMRTGETRWQIPFGRIEFGAAVKSLAAWGAPNQGGPIITAGGLVFIGASPDSSFRAYELATGREVWHADLPAPAIATPMTYAYGPGQRQFIVIAAGGHDRFETLKADAIVAFALRPAH
jgi:quinoprotein glucose dehydrogenase